MAVFGEESIPIPLNFGIDPTNGPASDKYCPKLQNFVLNSDGDLVVRDDVIAVQLAPAFTPRVIAVATNPIPKNSWERDVEVFVATGSQTVNSPSLLFCLDDGTTRNVSWVNCNGATPVTTTQAITPARGIKAFCQYKDRYYASNITDTIFRVSNFTTAATPLTITDLVSIAGVNLLLSFKNRIFGIFKNRIYYTDLPSIGGYPETWNSSLNFLDMPTADLDLTIYNAIVYKDRIYLFTDRGIYVFFANGAPINWSIQLVSADYPIYHRDSVAVNKGFIFLTDQTKIVAFNGVTFKDVTGSLKDIYGLQGFGSSGVPRYVTLKLYAFMEGIIIEHLTYTGAVNYTYSTSRQFYFDLNIWVEFLFGGVYSIVKAGTNLLPFRGKLGSSFIYNQGYGLYVDTRKYRGDCFDLTHDPVTGRVTKSIQFQTPSVLMQNKKFTRIKYVELYGYFNDNQNAIGFGLVEAGASGNYVNLAAGQFTNSSQYLKIAVEGSSGVRQASFVKGVASIYMFGSSKSDSNYPGQIPPIVISKMALTVNTDYKDKDQMSNV